MSGIKLVLRKCRLPVRRADIADGGLFSYVTEPALGELFMAATGNHGAGGRCPYVKVEQANADGKFLSVCLETGRISFNSKDSLVFPFNGELAAIPT